MVNKLWFSEVKELGSSLSLSLTPASIAPLLLVFLGGALLMCTAFPFFFATF